MDLTMNQPTIPQWLANLIKESPDATSLARKLYFHGTCEDIEGALQPGGYDGLLWFADSPMIAQHYIPAAGSSVLHRLPRYPWEYDEIIRVPDLQTSSVDFSIALALGHRLTYATFDENVNRYACCGWQWNDGSGKSPTRAETCAYLESLGYDIQAAMQDTGSLWLKTGDLVRIDIPAADAHRENACVFADSLLPADYRMPGKLYMIAREDFQLYDIATGVESSLLDLDYHKHATFAAARAEGYAGMKINDFAQTDRWGNLGHYSYGLFAETAATLTPYAIDCTRFSYAERVELGSDAPFYPLLTKEFDSFFTAAKQMLDPHFRPQTSRAAAERSVTLTP